MLAKRECKKIQGPSGEVYRLKIFWGKGESRAFGERH
jgi:hypothetical protein